MTLQAALTDVIRMTFGGAAWIYEGCAS